MRLLVPPFLLLALALPALAVDGVVEINQACVSTGCHPGDVAGFPVTLGLTLGGIGTSYRLTSDLNTSPDAGASAIVVTADHVTLDLNGFSLIGPAVCTGSGSTVSCTPGDAAGIAASNDSGLTVRNGTVRGFTGPGIIARERAQIRNVVAESNGGTGIEVGSRSFVSESTAHLNGENGISAGIGSVVQQNASSSNRIDGITGQNGSSLIKNSTSENGQDGINAGKVSTVSGNTAYKNRRDGIFADTGSTVSGNTAGENGNDGIETAQSNTIIGNTSYGNGYSTDPTFADGIQCSLGCVVRGNSVFLNSGYGLSGLSSSGYGDNVVTSNMAGTVLVSGGGTVNTGGNVCNGSPTCP